MKQGQQLRRAWAELGRFANYRRQFLTRTWVVCLPAAVGVLAIAPLAPALLGKSGFDLPVLLVGLMALLLLYATFRATSLPR